MSQKCSLCEKLYFIGFQVCMQSAPFWSTAKGSVTKGHSVHFHLSGLCKMWVKPSLRCSPVWRISLEWFFLPHLDGWCLLLTSAFLIWVWAIRSITVKTGNYIGFLRKKKKTLLLLLTKCWHLVTCIYVWYMPAAAWSFILKKTNKKLLIDGGYFPKVSKQKRSPQTETSFILTSASQI